MQYFQAAIDKGVPILRAEVECVNHLSDGELSEVVSVLLDRLPADTVWTDAPTKPLQFTEYGWVIERGDSESSGPTYWAAGQRDAERSSAWTSNHLEAIRFARKDDAEKLAKRLMPNIAVRVCEHGWGLQ